MEQIAALGLSLEKLYSSQRDIHVHDLSIAAQSCSNIREIGLEYADYPSDTIKQLLTFDKPFLASFHLKMDRNGGREHPDDALRELADRAGTLLEFSYTGTLPSTAALERFCRHAPLLENAYLHLQYFRDYSPNYESLAANIVGSFLTCPNFRDLEVNYMRKYGTQPERGPSPRVPAVADLCSLKRLERREISVMFLGVNY